MLSSPTTFMIQGDALHALRARCHAMGLEIRGARRRGTSLELMPSSLDHLPDAEVLREIADALGGDGVRYVSLSLEETAP